MLIDLLKTIIRPSNTSRKIHSCHNHGTVTIITPPHTLYLSHLLLHTLATKGFQVHINIGEFLGDFNGSYFVVLCPQVFKRLPASFLAFQMEQAGSNWFDAHYISLLKNNSVTILDYSAQNIPYLIEQGIESDHIGLAQLTTIDRYRDLLIKRQLISPIAPDKEYEVLFYGGINERRFRHLSRLDQEFRLKVAVGIFGPPLYELIERSRIVVNIHILDQSPLESTRIFEALSLGTHVVSESAPDLADYVGIEKHVSFVPINSIDEMIKSITARLQRSDTTKDSNPLSPSEGFSKAIDRAIYQLGWRTQPNH